MFFYEIKNKIKLFYSHRAGMSTGFYNRIINSLTIQIQDMGLHASTLLHLILLKLIFIYFSMNILINAFKP